MLLLTVGNLYEKWWRNSGIEESSANFSVDGTLTSESLQASNIVSLEIAVRLKWA